MRSLLRRAAHGLYSVRRLGFARGARGVAPVLPLAVLAVACNRPRGAERDLIRLFPFAEAQVQPFRDGDGQGRLPRIEAGGRELFIPAGAGVSYHLRLPPGGVLRFDGLAFPGDAGGTLTVRLERDGSGEEVVARLDATTGARPVTLPAHRGGILRLTLAAESGNRLGADATAGVRLAHPVLRLPGAAGRPVRAPRTAGRPNVLIYLIDTLRADGLGCYGYDPRVSPGIDALARDGILYRDAVAESSWTRSSVASLFTGLPATRHGVHGREDALPEEAVSMAEVFRRAGYETAAFVTNGNVAGLYGFAQGFDTFELLPGTIVPAPDGSNPPEAGQRPQPLSDEVNARVLAWLDARSDSRPLFLYLHTADPHSPYLPSDEFRARLGVDAPPDLGTLGTIGLLVAGKLPADDATARKLRALYEAEVAYNDHHFAKLVAELRRRGLYDGTLLVFLSDHGEEFHEHGGWEHGRTLYGEVTHVPLVLKLPASQGPRGVAVDRTVQLGDVLPTLIDYLGLEGPPGLEGTSLLALAEARDGGAPRAAGSHLDLDGHRIASVVEGRWKLVRTDDRVELYDRRVDPLERENVAAARPVTTAYLSAVLAERAALGPSLAHSGVAQMTDEVRHNLRALGYVQ